MKKQSILKPVMLMILGISFSFFVILSCQTSQVDSIVDKEPKKDFALLLAVFENGDTTLTSDQLVQANKRMNELSYEEMEAFIDYRFVNGRKDKDAATFKSARHVINQLSMKIKGKPFNKLTDKEWNDVEDAIPADVQTKMKTCGKNPSNADSDKATGARQNAISQAPCGACPAWTPTSYLANTFWALGPFIHPAAYLGERNSTSSSGVCSPDCDYVFKYTIPRGKGIHGIGTANPYSGVSYRMGAIRDCSYDIEVLLGTLRYGAFYGSPQWVGGPGVAVFDTTDGWCWSTSSGLKWYKNGIHHPFNDNQGIEYTYRETTKPCSCGIAGAP